jgi:uncharacterized protein (DUF1697 family)
MALHVAFLRAINVGGRVVKMDVLRALCEQCGLSKVETFIASGNVIFESRASAPALETKLEASLRKGLGYDVATFVRSVPELAAVVRTAGARGRDKARAHVGFLKTAPDREQQQKAIAFGNDVERFEFHGREIYWFTDGGVGTSKFSNAVLERILKSPATFRNITTVSKLSQKYSI